MQLKGMLFLVDEAENELIDKYANLNEMGKILDYIGKLKKQIGVAITIDSIDVLYGRPICSRNPSFSSDQYILFIPFAQLYLCGVALTGWFVLENRLLFGL